MVCIVLKKKLKNGFVGKQNESKKIKRSRKVGPSQKMQQTNRALMLYGTAGIVVGSIKTARTPHINIIVSLGNNVLQHRRAHQGYRYGQKIHETARRFTKVIPTRPGSVKRLFMLRSGTTVFNIPVGKFGGMLARAAGTFCKILWHQTNVWLTVLRIPSKKLLKISMTLHVTLGRNANKFFNKLNWGCAKKTTKNYKKVRRVRGVAMNPVDHPNGGRANTKQPLKNPWGAVAKCSK